MYYPNMNIYKIYGIPYKPIGYIYMLDVYPNVEIVFRI